jgi:hypothetical protein
VLPTLTNYVSDFMTNTIAELYNGSAVFGGTGTALFPRYYVTMVDSANNPISGPFAVGSASLAFHDSGEVR